MESHEDRTLAKGVSALLLEDPESFQPSRHSLTRLEGPFYAPEDTQFFMSCSQTFQNAELWRKMFLFIKCLVHDILLLQSKWTTNSERITKKSKLNL